MFLTGVRQKFKELGCVELVTWTWLPRVAPVGDPRDDMTPEVGDPKMI